jgi:hypothetical protein
MRRLTIALAVLASTAVFAAVAKGRHDAAPSIYPNLGVALPVAKGAEYGDTSLTLAPSSQLRPLENVEPDVTYAPRWRLSGTFGYDRSTVGSTVGSTLDTDIEPDAAGDERLRNSRDGRSPWEGGGPPHVRF